MFLILILILLLTIVLLSITYLVLYIFGKRQIILVKWIFSVLIKMKINKIIKNKRLDKEEFEYFLKKFKKDLSTKNLQISTIEIDNKSEEEHITVYKITIDSVEQIENNETQSKIHKEFFIIEKHSKYIFSLFYPTNRYYKVFGQLNYLFNYAKALNFLLIMIIGIN